MVRLRRGLASISKRSWLAAIVHFHRACFAARTATQGFGMPTESYGFANKRLAWETIAPLLDRASPLRTAHLRDPVGPQIQFASESFIDEIAAAVGGSWCLALYLGPETKGKEMVPDLVLA